MAIYKEYGFSGGEICSHSYLMPSLLKLLHKEKNKTILDVGCGDGAIARALMAEGFDVYGSDASQQGISIAQQQHPDRFFLQDLTKDTLPKGLQHITFDTIISTEVVEHLYDPRGYIKFCKDVLLKNGGGELIISTPYNGYLKNMVLSVLDKWDLHLNPLWDGGHIKFWSRKTLTALVEEQGFKLVQFEGSGRLPYLWKSMFIKARL
ncbi:class I SAM-dependent methyltransferase [Algoriphagus formosus]|uniref:class I SAM-dependent methyltransferase n=1 Tax=Algoriphagus formosus TaxID=2007308 RepID=UPI003F6E6963